MVKTSQTQQPSLQAFFSSSKAMVKPPVTEPATEMEQLKAGLHSPATYTSQFYFCPNFFSADTYKGCAHGCKYCFARFTALTNASCVGDPNYFDKIEQVNLNSLRQILWGHKMAVDEAKLHKAVEIGMPLHIGGLSDPFQPFERVKGWTKTFLQILNNTPYPYIISTKNALIADREYLDLLKTQKETVVQISLIHYHEKLKLLEPKASEPWERLRALQVLGEEGIYTVCRMQPFIPWLYTSDDELKEFIGFLSKAKVKAVTVEFLKLFNFQTPAILQLYKEMSEALGVNLLSFYRKWRDTAILGNDLELDIRFKLPWMLKLRDFVHQAGMKFYSADNALRVLGDGACCCGYEEGRFPNNHYESFGNKLPFIAEQKGEVTFYDLYAEPPSVLTFRDTTGFLNSQNRDRYWERKNWNFMDYIKTAWNDSQHPNNPANFFANLKCSMFKREGYFIYHHDKNWMDDVLNNTKLEQYKGSG